MRSPLQTGRITGWSNHHHRDVAFFKGNVFWSLSDTCMLITDEWRAILQILLFLFAVFLLTFLQFLRRPSFRYFHPLKNFMVLRAEQMQGPKTIPSKNWRRQNVTMSKKSYGLQVKRNGKHIPPNSREFSNGKSSNSSKVPGFGGGGYVILPWTLTNPKTSVAKTPGDIEWFQICIKVRGCSAFRWFHLKNNSSWSTDWLDKNYTKNKPRWLCEGKTLGTFCWESKCIYTQHFGGFSIVIH